MKRISEWNIVDDDGDMTQCPDDVDLPTGDVGRLWVYYDVKRFLRTGPLYGGPVPTTLPEIWSLTSFASRQVLHIWRGVYAPDGEATLVCLGRADLNPLYLIPGWNLVDFLLTNCWECEISPRNP